MRNRPDLSPRITTALVGALLAVSTFALACSDAPPVGPEHFTRPLPLSLAISPSVDGAEAQAVQDAFDRVDRFRVIVKRKDTKETVADTIIEVTSGQTSYDLAIEVPLLEGEESATFIVELLALDGDVELFTATVDVTVAVETLGQEPEPVTVPVTYTGPGIHGSVMDTSGNAVGGVTVDLLRDGSLLSSTVSDDDGVFLFTDLQAGTYTLRPQGGAGTFFCPSTKSVRLQSATATVDAVLRSSSSACGVKVLVLSGGDVDHTSVVASTLAAEMSDSRFDTYFVIHTPPSVEYLSQFNVVLLFEDGVFGDSKRTGDAVAEYLEGGGSLVIGSFYWQNRSDGSFDTRGWGALEGLDPFTAAGGARYTGGSINAASIVTHPLTDGVSAFSVSSYWGGVAAKGGTTVVASWSDGTPAVGFLGGGGSPAVVAISTFPGQGDVRLWSNALSWAGSGGLSATSAPSRIDDERFVQSPPPPGAVVDASDPAGAVVTSSRRSLSAAGVGGTRHR